MAHGNNGNLLQHGVECALAARLANPDLTVLIAHGMRPFERFEEHDFPPPPAKEEVSPAPSATDP